MNRWGRFGLWCAPMILLGCQQFSIFEESSIEEEQAARRLEKASVRAWAEQKPTFPVSRFLAARAWERNLRGLGMEPSRSGNFVECVTPQGHSFCLAFWEGKAGEVDNLEKNTGTCWGQMQWHRPEDAGAGMICLLDLEKKNRPNAGEKK